MSTGKDRLDFPEVDSSLTGRSDKEELLRLNEVLINACAGDARKRYPSAAAMHEDLCRLAAGQAPRRKRSVAKWIVVTGVLIVGALGAFALRDRLGITRPVVATHLQTIVQTEPPGALVLLGDHANKSPATFTDLGARKYKVF